MEREALQALLRLRRFSFEEAARLFADALAEERRAGHVVQELLRKIAAEQEQAANPEGDDALVEAFGRWFRRTRAELTAAQSMRARAEAEAARARAVLTAARAALAAVEREAENRARAAEAEALARDQRLIDDLAGRQERRRERGFP